MNTKTKIILLGLLTGILFYLTDSIIDYLVFAGDRTFIGVLLTDVPLFEVYNRALMVLGFVLLSILLSGWLSDLSIENEFLRKKTAPLKNRKDSDIINTISCQIRSPLNAIVGFSELLRDPALSEKTRQTYISHINNSSQFLLQLVNNLVDVSRMEEDEVRLSLTECRLGELLDELEEYFHLKKDEMGKEAVELRFVKLPPEKEQPILIDRERLKQMLIYLFENGLKHTERGFVELGYSLKDEEILEFYVKDTGRGITDEKLKTIFSRYKKFTDDQNQPFDETSIRLGITKTIVKVLGGNIWAYSKPGEGSGFYVTLPYVEVVSQVNPKIEGGKESQPGPAQPKWKNKTILIAEDVESNFIYLQELLRPAGAVILWAENGKNAVEMARNHPEINLVLMDILMPEMDGYQAAKLISGIRPGIPIIAQTAYSADTNGNEERTKYFSAYLVKPIWSVQLDETISRFLGERSPVLD